MDVSLQTILDYYSKLTRDYDNGSLLPPEVILPPVPEVTEDCSTVPSPQEYLLPSVILWDPRQQLDCFANGIQCPFNGHSDDEVCLLEPKRTRKGDFSWQAGERLSLMPRLLCSSSWPTVLLSRIYYCNSKIKHRNYIAHDAEILSKIPPSESCKIPFVLLHRTGFTKELGETVSSLIASGMSLIDIEQVIYQQHINNFAQCKAKFEQDKDACLPNMDQEAVPLDATFFPDYKSVGIPSMEMILESLLDNFPEFKPYYNQRMSDISAEVLLMGHFFKSSQQMGTLGVDGKKWVPMYGYVFAVMNERGQVVAWKVTKGTSINDVAPLLENVHQRLVKQGVAIKLILMPECCKNKEFIMSIFGADVEVKMDPTFALYRLEKRLKIRKEDHNNAINCLQDFTLVFNKSTDLSSERKEETPSSDVILGNFKSFMSHWKMKRGESNERLLHDPALQELEAIKQSIVKGCLSGTLPNSGAKYVSELREFLEPILNKRFLNTELALPAIAVLLYHWNENHGVDCFVPINSYKAAIDATGFIPTSEKFGCVDVEVESGNKENEQTVLSSEEIYSSQLYKLLWNIDDECCVSSTGLNNETLNQAILSKVLIQVESCYLVHQNLKSLSLGNASTMSTSIWNYHALPCCTQLFSRSNYEVKQDDSKLQQTLQDCGAAILNLEGQDGFFSALSHSIETLLTTLESECSADLLHVKEQFSLLGYNVDELKSEEEKVTVLRQLVSHEWLKNKEEYSSLLVSPLLNFTQEAELFQHNEYYQEMVNLLPVAATRVVQLPLIIFTAMEHFPVVPIMSAGKPLTSKCLYMAYSATGFGCYYSVTISHHPSNTQEKPKHVCRCGLGNSKNKHERQFCVQIPGKYLTRCECFRNGALCNYLCRCFNCANPKGTSTESRASNASQKTRLRTKHKLQLMKKEFVNLPNEAPKTSWSEKECLALTFLITAIQYSHSLASPSEISPETLLEEYNKLQQLSQGQTILRQKSLEDIRKHMTIASRSSSKFMLLYRKQMEKQWGEGCDPVHLDISDSNQLVVIVESSE